MSKNLFDNFNSASPNWEALVDKELKKTDAASELIWQTHEGFSIFPYQSTFLSEQTRILADQISNLVLKRNRPEFFSLQQFEETDSSSLAKKLNAALNGGVNALKISGSIQANELDKIFNNVFTEVLWIEITSENRAEIANAFSKLLSNRSVSPSTQTGSIALSPLQELATKKTTPNFSELKNHLDQMQAKLPSMRAVKIDASIIANGGGNISQQIAFALSQGNEYLNWAAENNIPIEQFATKLHFNFAIGSNFLPECVKVRAFRWLWAKVLEQYGVKELNTFISTETATFGYSVYDSHNNLLRATTASMSAIISGTDAHLVVPFDSEYRNSSDFSDRIARNITNLLLEESFLEKVENPTSGSFAFDNIQHQLCEKAWETFKNWENKGGYIQAIDQILTEVNTSADQLKEAFKNGTQIILGVNKYPNKLEKKQEEIQKDLQKEKVNGLNTFRISELAETERLNQEGVEVK